MGNQSQVTAELSQGEIDRLQKQLARSVPAEDLNVALNQLDSAKTENEQLQGQLSRMVPEAEFSALEQQLGAAVSEVDDLKLKLSHAREAAHDEKVAAIRSKIAEMAGLSAELDACKAANRTLQGALDTANAETQQLEQYTKGLEAQLTGHISRADAAAKDLSEAQAELQELRAKEPSVDPEELILMRKDLERRARTVDNSLRLQEIAEKRCKLLQQRLQEEMDRQRGLAGHMRNTLEHFDKAEEERESLEEPYWSVAKPLNASPQLGPFQWPQPEDFPELAHYIDGDGPDMRERASSKTAKLL